jgi:hypothetical protein
VINWTSRAAMASLMRGPSLLAGSGLIGRRMVVFSYVVDTIPNVCRSIGGMRSLASAAFNKQRQNQETVNASQVN